MEFKSSPLGSCAWAPAHYLMLQDVKVSPFHSSLWSPLIGPETQTLGNFSYGLAHWRFMLSWNLSTLSHVKMLWTQSGSYCIYHREAPLVPESLRILISSGLLLTYLLRAVFTDRTSLKQQWGLAWSISMCAFLVNWFPRLFLKFHVPVRLFWGTLTSVVRLLALEARAVLSASLYE